MVSKPTTDSTVPSVARTGWRLLTAPVWNHEQKRLRSPLRALLPLVVTFVALAVLLSPVRDQFNHPLRESVELLVLLTVLVGGILLSGKVFDRRPIAEYGLVIDRTWLRSFAVGGLIGTVVNAGTFLVALSVGWVSVVDVARGGGALPFLLAVVLTFAMIAVAASWEEFVFRGAMLKNLAEGADGYLPRWAAVGSRSVSVLVCSHLCTPVKSRV